MKPIFTIVAMLCYATLFSQAGALDSTFANKGKFVYAANSYPFYFSGVTATALQKDGKILLAGYGNNYSVGNGSQDFAVLRLNAGGSVDNTFGTNGEVFVDFSNLNATNYTNDAAYSIAVQADGKIVLAGIAYSYGYVDSSQSYNNSDIAVARLNTNGSFDATFNTTGKAVIDLTAYSSGGNLYTSSYDYCYAVAIKPNGKIALGGATYVNDQTNGNHFDAVLAELNGDGSRDQAFAIGGVQVIKKPGGDDYINTIAIQKDGKIVGGGITYNTATSYDLLAIRLKTNGTPDSTFAGNGTTAFDINNGSFDEEGAVAIQPNGKIVLGGYTSGTAAVIRLNANGSLDNTFNGNGKSLVNASDIASISGIAIQKDGKIVQTGTDYAFSDSQDINYLGSDNFLVLRYNAAGGLDTSFGTLGKSIVDFGNYINGSPDYNQACAIQPDGKIIAAGIINGQGIPCAARLQTTGKNYGLTGPADQADTTATGNCTVTLTNISPVLHPDTSLSLVKYTLYRNNFSPAAFDSGYGSVSGKPFDIGSTTVVYTSTIDPLQRAVFTVNVSGGTPGGALSFDGINDRVDLVNITDPVSYGTFGQYTFEGWIKLRGYNPNGGSVIFGDERNNNGGIVVSLDTKGYITTYQPSVGTVTSKYKVPLNKWTHIAFVQSSTKLDLYVNGKYVQTLLTAPNLHAATYSNFYLGAYTSDNVNFSRNFNGEMDEVRIWNNAICGAQIQNNLHCELPGYLPNLVAYFNFNEGLASCNNQTVGYLNSQFGAYGVLQNFALTGPVSNWVTGYVSGACAVFTPLAITSYPNAINVQTTNDSCSATVNFAITVSSGCSDSVSIVYSQNPGTLFPIGTTYISATAQDNFGNSQTVYFPVTVLEITPPVLVLKDTSIALSQNGYTYISPYDLIDTLYDNCTPGNNLYVSASNNYFYCYNAGANTISVTATDQSGNSTTKTATVTLLPFAGTASITASPNPQQYSDVATLQATLYGAQNFYFNGCLPTPSVAFKVSGKTIGTTTLYPDYNGNLVATLNYVLTDIFPKKLTATFTGIDTAVYGLPAAPVTTTLNGTPENAVIDYIESQLISTSTNKVTLPVAAQITDTADGSGGDIRKSIVTFTVQPVTAGATVVGANTLTVSALELVSADHTTGVAKGSFTVNTGGNPNAKFNIIVTVSNYYTGNKTALVYVSKSGSISIVADKKSALSGHSALASDDDYFGVTVSPNPSNDRFALAVTSHNTIDDINIRILDVAGKVLETFSRVTPGEVIQFGANYHAGIYMAEISQGKNKKSYKLIKL